MKIEELTAKLKSRQRTTHRTVTTQSEATTMADVYAQAEMDFIGAAMTPIRPPGIGIPHFGCRQEQQHQPVVGEVVPDEYTPEGEMLQDAFDEAIEHLCTALAVMDKLVDDKSISALLPWRFRADLIDKRIDLYEFITDYRDIDAEEAVAKGEDPPNATTYFSTLEDDDQAALDAALRKHSHQGRGK